MDDYWDNPELRAAWQALPGSARDTLRALLYEGPLWDGDVPSKSGRDLLVAAEMAAKVLVSGKQGYQACTCHGYNVYRAGNPEKFEPADHLASQAIERARS